MLAIIGIPTFLLELLMNLLIKMFTTYTPRGFSSPATSGFYQKTSFVQSYICSRIWFLFTVAFSCFLWDNTQVLWGWTTPTGEVPRRWFLFTIDIGEAPRSPHVSHSPHSPHQFLIFLGSAHWIGWWKLPGLAVWHFGSLAVSSPAPWSGTRMCQYSWEVCQYSWKVWQYSWQGDFSLHFKWHMLSKKLWFPPQSKRFDEEQTADCSTTKIDERVCGTYYVFLKGSHQ